MIHPGHPIYNFRQHLFLFLEGVLQWSSCGDGFLLEMLYKPPGWLEFKHLPSELLNPKYNFGLHRFYIVEDPLEAVFVGAPVSIPAILPYNGDFKVSDAGGV